MIRHVLPIDYESILHIKQVLALDVSRLGDSSYKLEIEQKGFLLPSPYLPDDFHKDLRKVFLVSEMEGKVVGFLRIDEIQDFRKDSPLEWLRPEFKETYFSTPHAVMGGIGVLPEYTHRGLATQLFNEGKKEVIARNIPDLFSLVTTSPVCNYPSLKFHEHAGFIKVAEREKGEVFGLHNYQSVLFVNVF